MKTIIPIEMVGSWLFDDVIDMLWTVTEIEIDPADYDGIQHAWFEVNADNYSGALGYGTYPTDKYLRLVDASLNVYATVTVPYGLPFRNGRYRQEFTLNPAKTKYYVFTPASDAVNQQELDWRTARILLEVDGATKGRFEIPLIDGDASSGGGFGDAAQNNHYAWAQFSSFDTYNYGGYFGSLPDYSYFRTILIDKSKWSHITKWEFEAMGSSDILDGNTGYIALFDKTTDTMVPGSELSFTTTVPTRKIVTIADSDIVDGHEFTIKLKSSNNSYQVNVHRAGMFVTCDQLTKAEVHQRVVAAIGQNGAENEARWYWEPSKFPAGSPVYFEMTGMETGAGSANLMLLDGGTNDIGYNSDISLGAVHAEVGAWNTPDNLFICAAGVPFPTSCCWIQVAPGQTVSVTVSGFTCVPSGTLRKVYASASVGAWNSDSTPAQITIAGTGGTKTFSVFSFYETPPPNPVYHTPNIKVGLTPAGLNQPVTITFVSPAGSYGTALFLINCVQMHGEWGETVPASELDFSLVNTERKRTSDLSADLTDQNRYFGYINWVLSPSSKMGAHSSGFLITEVQESLPTECVSVSAAIDSESLLVTGTGTGTGADQWRVIRVSDGVVMDSGSGNSASFSFIGAYDVVYQLQFGVVTP